VRVNKPGVVAAPGEFTTITYEGEPVTARCGESIAAALVASGRLAFRRARSGEDRGLFCGMGVCSECAVQVDGEAGRLACMEQVVAGASVERNPPARRLDASGPQLFDLQSLPEETLDADVLVIGAGPAGLRAALAASRAGASVVVVDERAHAGGQYLKQPGGSLEVDESALDEQYRTGRALVREVADSGAQLLAGVRVWGCCGPRELYGVSRQARLVLRNRALVLATGAYERAAPFPGWTLPGVMTTGAAQTLLRSYLVSPGARVLVAGNGPLNLQVAAELATAGVRVVAVAEAAPLLRPSSALHLAGMAGAAPRYASTGVSYLSVLARRRVPLLTSATVVEVTGDGRAELATVARIDQEGRPLAAGARHFEVDAVCLGLGFVPSSELARSLGCAHRLDERTGALVVERDRNGRTPVAGVWVAGDGGGIGGAQVAQAMGFLAGLDAATFLGLPIERINGPQRLARRQLARSERFQRSLWRLYSAPLLVDQLAAPATVVCRCEEVTLAQLSAAAAPWLASAGSIKRATRAGMGKCQGRYCSVVLTALAARQSGQPVGARSGFAPQAPFTPVPVAVAASGTGTGDPDDRG
jgi:NADPH-dependent 2,4-dienoyl-CoA reductase/sulfur reductase-like enzyme